MSHTPAIALLVAYYGVLAVVTIYAVHRLHLVILRRRSVRQPLCRLPTVWPPITVQLPLFNEAAVAERLIDAAGRLQYPGALDIQVLDDSTDETVMLVEAAVRRIRRCGVAIEHVRRGARDGYKAGALAYGMTRSSAELFAIFDADFIPPSDTLLRMVPAFARDTVGMVQARWDHLNRGDSLLTSAQAIFLDAHFAVESAGRYAAGRFFNFNGTAGIWRRKAIETAGGWSASTLTEDLDLSYRAQLAGWEFVFLPDVAIPAELPSAIGAFHEQQFRWAKGSVQTARRLLGGILRAPIAPAAKIEAAFHLTANVAYVLTLLLAILMVPSMDVRSSMHASWTYAVDATLFFVSTAAVLLFYIEGQRLLGRSRPRLLELIAVMPIGIGLSVRNSAAVVEGLISRGGEFRRTPKRGLTGRKIEHAGALPAGECLLAIYFATAGTAALLEHQYMRLPFLALFFTGYAYTAVRSWTDRFASEPPALALMNRSLAAGPATAVIIPALNEESSIGRVLRDLPRDLARQIIVVDNGSTDSTAAVARRHGAIVVAQPERGYGAACLAGLAAVDTAIEVVVFLDADYSDYPEDLHLLLQPIVDGDADLVIGSRTCSRTARQALTPQQRFGNWLATRLIKILWRHGYSDLGPFRAIRRDSLEALAMSDRNFGWNVEMQIKALRGGLRVTEVAVRYRQRIGESKISGTFRGTILAGTKILYTIGKYACA